MSDALLIAIAATGIAALIIGVVTWMLVLPARAMRRSDRVRPQTALPLVAAECWADAAESGEGRGSEEEETRPTACTDTEAPDMGRLLQEMEALSQAGNKEAAARRAKVLRWIGDTDPTVLSLADEEVITPEFLVPIPVDTWVTSVCAPATDRALTGIIALLGPEVITWQAHPADRYGLHRRQRLESQAAPPRITELAPGIARALGARSPVFFITPERKARLVHINLAVAGRYTAALAVGGQALSFTDDAVIRFMLGRKMTYMRSEYLLCTAADGPDDLMAVHLAVGQILMPGLLPKPPENVFGLDLEEALPRLRELFHDAEIALLMRRLLRAAGQDVTRERWAQWLLAAAETSFRCGLLVCGDLNAALTILELDDMIPGTDREHRQCYNALYRFYVSDAYEAIRLAMTG